MQKVSGWRPRGVVAFMLLFAAVATPAADLGFYAIVDGAYSTAHTSLPVFHSQVAGTVGEQIADTAVDTNMKGIDLTVGYQLGSYFAIEGSYLLSGSASYHYTGLSSAEDGRFKGKLGGLTTSAVGLLPLGEYFSLDGHAGFFFVDNKYDLSIGADTLSGNDTKTSIYLGSGVAWWMTGQVALRFGFNWFRRALFSEDVTQYTLGLRYSYGY